MDDDRQEKRPLPAPTPPSLVAKLDRLQALRAEVRRLEQEVQAEYIALHKQDPTRYQQITERMKTRKLPDQPRQQRNSGQSLPKFKWLSKVEDEGGDK